MRRVGVIAVLAALVAGACGAAPSAVLTAYRVAEGSVTRYAIDMDFDGSMEFAFAEGQKPEDAPEGAIPFKMDLRFTSSQKATKTDAGTRLDVTMSDVSGSVEAGGEKVGADELSDELEKQKFSFEIDKSGKVVSANGQALPENLQMPTSGLPGTDLRGAYVQLPEGGAEPGDTWTTKDKVPFLGGEEIVSKHRYVRTDTVDGEKVAVIETEMDQPFDTVLSFEDLAAFSGQEPPEELKETKMTLKGSMTTTTTTYLRLGDSVPVKLDSKGSFDMDFGFQGGSEALEGLTGMSFKGDIRMGITVQD